MDMKKRFLFPFLALCILGGTILLTLALISPPAPLPVDAPAADFSAGRAMQDLAVIAQEPRPMGAFSAHAAVRDYLLGEIRKIGLDPQVQDTFGLRLWGPASGYVSGGFVENVLVRLPGSLADGAILLIAHYDSTPGGPGAGDNGSGVVTLLELMRALRAGPALRQDVIALFADGHEPGVFGTRAFIDQHPWVKDITLVINIDTIRDGPPGLTQTIQGNGLWVQALASVSQKPAFQSLPLHLFPSSDNDLVPFTQTGIPGAGFGTTISQEIHTALDRPEIVNPGSIQQAGGQILGLVRYLGDMPSLDIQSSGTEDLAEQTFFPMLGEMMYYPVSWVWPLTVISSLCFLGMIIYGIRRSEFSWKELGLGFLAVLVCLTLSVAITHLLWLGIQALHPEYRYSSVRPHLSEDHLYAIGFFALALAISTSVIAAARKKISDLNLAAGALAVWFPLTIAVTILIPATSYLAAWMLLSGSLALLLALKVRSTKLAWGISGLGFLASAVLAIFLWIPFLNTAFLGLGFTMDWLLIGVVALWLCTILPILDWIASPKRWLVPASAGLVGIGLLLAGHFLVGQNSPPPLVNSIGYWLDAENNHAYWLAFIGGYRIDAHTNARYLVPFPEAMDERQNDLLVNPVRRDYTEFFPKAPDFSVLTSEAPLVAHEGPNLEVISDQWIDNRRVLRIKFSTSMRDRLYIVLPDAPLLAITVQNTERCEFMDNSEWWLRFDGISEQGIEIIFEFSTSRLTQFLLVEEKTGLPVFSGLSTQPSPGTMRSPGEFLQGDATDFTAIYRPFVIAGSDHE